VIYGYGERSGTFQVWLDAWTCDGADLPWPSDAHGVVCERHALSISAPVGWDLVDRRESVPRLFVAKPFLVHSRGRFSSEPSGATGSDLRGESAANGGAVPRETDDSAALRRRRVTDLPIPQLFADLHGEDRLGSEPVAAQEPPRDPVADNSSARSDSTSMDDDGGLSGLLDATGPLLRRAFGKRNTGRHDASKELMRPTTYRVVDESA